MSIRSKIKEIKHLRNRHLICVLENPKEAINISTVIRNVSALGVEKVYVIGGYPGIPKTFEAARASKSLLCASVGSAKWTFYKHFETVEDCVAHLRKKDYTIAVTSPHLKGKENTDLYSGNFTQKRLAVWFGNESTGISGQAEEAADLCVQIPMGGIVESFNLGTSTGIVLSFIREQRLGFMLRKAERKLLKA